MYNSNNSNNSRGGRNGGGNSRGGNRRYGGGGGGNRRYGRGGGRRQSSFNPSKLVQKAVAQEPKPAYIPVNKFTDFAVHNSIMENIIKRGYENPTPIQDKIINHIMDGRDVIGLASTGTGKTAAFLIPLIHNIQKNGGRVLIMAPTRELALQIEAEFRIFSKGMRMYSAMCIGGASMFKQVDALKRNPEFVIGTPGRLIDLEKRRKINFNTFTAIVLDEVDQMLDMGFINDMRYVVDKLPREKHALFFSATLADKLNSLVHSFLNNPIKVEIERQKVSTNINQDIIKIKGRAKVDVLHELLEQDEFEKVLVFGRTKHGLNKLSQNLYDRGFRVAAIHGNKSQSQRQRALQQFKRNQVQVLLATDIASRGLDIDDVSHVINYDLPATQEDYIHRIGRTGRANKTGNALTFVD